MDKLIGVKRKVQRRHYWPLGILIITIIVIAVPADLYILFIFEQRQKVEATTQLIKDLTVAVKTGVLLVGALTALIVYKVTSK